MMWMNSITGPQRTEPYRLQVFPEVVIASSPSTKNNGKWSIRVVTYSVVSLSTH
jgi:hypothetical protein